MTNYVQREYHSILTICHLTYRIHVCLVSEDVKYMLDATLLMVATLNF